MKITKDMILHEIMKSHPGTIKVFDSYNMGCKSCGGGKQESVEWAAMNHGVSLAELLDKLNGAAQK